MNANDLRVIYTPFARVLHHEGGTRGFTMPPSDVLRASMLMARGGNDEAAYGELRRLAMEGRVTIEEAARRVVEGGSHGRRRAR